jgi:DNA-binding CsgD family transcriptional regulator
MGGAAWLLAMRDETFASVRSEAPETEGATRDALIRDGNFQVVDALGLGVLILDAAKRVVFASRRAADMIRDGEALTVSHGGRLRAGDPADRAELDRRLDAATVAPGPGAEGLLMLRRPFGEPLFVLVLPLDRAPRPPGALVLVSDPEGTPGSLADIGRLYGLTRAETRLLDSLLRGRSLAEHARATATSLNTVKSQLRQIFAKTGYCRQSQLVGGLLKNPLVHFLLRRGADSQG